MKLEKRGIKLLSIAQFLGTTVYCMLAMAFSRKTKSSHHNRGLSRSKQGADKPYAHGYDILPVSAVSPLGTVISWIHLLAAASS